MQIIVANIAKSIRNLKLLQAHMLATMNIQKPIILAIIEPPLISEEPSLPILLNSFFPGGPNGTNVVYSQKIKNRSKIIYVENKQTAVTPLSAVASIENHEAARCFGIGFSSGAINYQLHVIHGLDLINYPETDFERNVCEYNIYKQIRAASQLTPTLVVGDFNAKTNSASINSKFGLDAAIDDTKKYSFLNVTSRLISEGRRKNPNAKEISGSFYYHGNKYGESKWCSLDQLLVNQLVQLPNIVEAYYVSNLFGGIDLVEELKKTKDKSTKRQYFDHLPIFMRLA
jgi:hypothetical protein